MAGNCEDIIMKKTTSPRIVFTGIVLFSPERERERESGREGGRE